MGLLALAGAPVERAEAEVAVGDEGSHAARLGQRQRLAVAGLAALGVEPVGMGRDVAEQVLSMGCGPRASRRGFDGALAQAPRLVEPAEQQIGTTQRVVGPTMPADDSPRRLTLEELLPSRSRVSASLTSPTCARTQAEVVTAGRRERTMFPVRYAAIPCWIVSAPAPSRP